nr:SRPBCC domain-containing protein [Candidatus Acidoferrales bacterium]
VAQWWGPTGFTTPVCELDVRPGGAILIHMRAPDGTIYPMSGIYNEIVPPERLVFTATPLDKDGKVMFENLNTVIFSERDGKTTVMLRVEVVKSSAAAEQHLAGMEMGWKLTLDRLEAHVVKS